MIETELEIEILEGISARLSADLDHTTSDRSGKALRLQAVQDVLKDSRAQLKKETAT